MKATIILDNIKNDESIIECLINTAGIFNVVKDSYSNKLTFHFSTHNAMEGLREKLVRLEYSFELIY